jgi:hypothetical protein
MSGCGNRGFAIVPSIDNIPNGASVSYEMTRKNPIEGSWMYSGELPTNKTGIPFGLLNGLIEGIWVGASNDSEFDVEIYHHLGNELSLTLLVAAFTVDFSPTNLTLDFTDADYGVTNIPQGVQLAAKIVNVVTAPNDLKIILRPTGDQP